MSILTSSLSTFFFHWTRQYSTRRDLSKSSPPSGNSTPMSPLPSGREISHRALCNEDAAALSSDSVDSFFLPSLSAFIEWLVSVLGVSFQNSKLHMLHLLNTRRFQYTLWTSMRKYRQLLTPASQRHMRTNYCILCQFWPIWVVRSFQLPPTSNAHHTSPILFSVCTPQVDRVPQTPASRRRLPLRSSILTNSAVGLEQIVRPTIIVPLLSPYQLLLHWSIRCRASELLRLTMTPMLRLQRSVSRLRKRRL